MNYRTRSAPVFFPLWILFLLSPALSAIPAAATQVSPAEQGKALMAQGRFADAEEVFKRWVTIEPQNPEAQFQLALSRTRQGHSERALSGFQQVLQLDPMRADACFEIGDLLLKDKRYHDSLHWVERGLHLEPGNRRGLELAGAIYFANGRGVESLRFWNRLGRPRLTSTYIHSTARLNAAAISQEINLKAGDLITHRALQKARWRLERYDNINAVVFNPSPAQNPDEAALEADIDSRNAFGTPLEFLFHTFRNIGFSTVQLSYWNLKNKGITANLSHRWKSAARWVGFDLLVPRPWDLPIYTTSNYAWHDDQWRLQAGPGESPESFRLRTHELGTSALIPLSTPELAVGVGISYRRRVFEPVPTLQGTPTKPTAFFRQSQWERSRGVMQIQITPRIRLIDRSSRLGWNLHSELSASFNVGRIENPDSRGTYRQSASWESRLDRTNAGGRQTSLLLGFHAGHLSEHSVAEDHSLLAVGPDVDYELRAHPVFRGNRFGTTPLARQFFLANLTVVQDIITGKWLNVGVVGFCDIAQLQNLYPGQYFPRTVTDTGFGVDLGLRKFPGARLTLTYGHDWKRQRNVFYLGSSFR